MDFLITLLVILAVIIVASILLGKWSDAKADRYLQSEEQAQKAYDRQHEGN